jgi:hypothetical protein
MRIAGPGEGDAFGHHVLERVHTCLTIVKTAGFHNAGAVWLLAAT